MEIFPELHTQRLLLRRLNADDIPLLVKYANNPKISEQVLNIPFPYGELDAVSRIRHVTQAFNNRSGFSFGIAMKQNNELIGEIGLHYYNSRKEAQLAYWIAEPFWGKGIASEAVKAVIEFGIRQMKLNAIFAECNADNMASQKVAMNNGMKKTKFSGGVAQLVITSEEHSNS